MHHPVWWTKIITTFIAFANVYSLKTLFCALLIFYFRTTTHTRVMPWAENRAKIAKWKPSNTPFLLWNIHNSRERARDVVYVLHNCIPYTHTHGIHFRVCGRALHRNKMPKWKQKCSARKLFSANEHKFRLFTQHRFSGVYSRVVGASESSESANSAMEEERKHERKRVCWKVAAWKFMVCEQWRWKSATTVIIIIQLCSCRHRFCLELQSSWHCFRFRSTNLTLFSAPSRSPCRVYYSIARIITQQLLFFFSHV